MIYVLLLIKFLEVSALDGLNILLDGSDKLHVFENNQLSHQFDSSFDLRTYSCSPPYTFTDENDNMDLVFENTDFVEYYYIDSVDIRLEKSDSIIQLSYEQVNTTTLIKPQQSIYYKIKLECMDNKTNFNNNNYWSNLQVKVQVSSPSLKNPQLIKFYIAYTCDLSFRYIRFDLSLLILIVYSFLVISILAKYQQIKSFQIQVSQTDHHKHYFSGFFLSKRIIFIIGFLYLASVYLIVKKTQTQLYLQFTILLFSLFAGWLNWNDFIYSNPRLKFFKKYLIKSFILSIRLCDIQGITIMMSIICAYIYTDQAWYISNSIAMIICFCLIKIVKAKCFMTTVYMCIVFMILDLIVALTIHYTRKESYDLLMLKDFNCPMTLQMPLHQVMFDKKCSWISLNNIFIPGLIISYCYRYDYNKKGIVYTLVSLFSLLIGSVIWILAQVRNKHAWPQSIFIYPAVILSLTVLSIARSDFFTFYNGLFFDQYLNREVSFKEVEDENERNILEKRKKLIKKGNKEIDREYMLNDKLFDFLEEKLKLD